MGHTADAQRLAAFVGAKPARDSLKQSHWRAPPLPGEFCFLRHQGGDMRGPEGPRGGGIFRSPVACDAGADPRARLTDACIPWVWSALSENEAGQSIIWGCAPHTHD